MTTREAKIYKTVKRMKVARCSDARKAIGATWSNYYLQKLIDKGLVKRIARDQYVAVK